LARCIQIESVASKVEPSEFDYLMVKGGVELRHIASGQVLMETWHTEYRYNVRKHGMEGLYAYVARKMTASVEKRIRKFQELSAQ
jgi:hypothetical protein